MKSPKLIIVEGVDRCGKDTLITELKQKYGEYVIVHFTTPIGNTNAEKIEYQKQSFHQEFLDASDRKTTVFFNRSHIGEYVYGKMYRDYDPSWIFDLEKTFYFDKDTSVYLILLYGDAEFLIANDDGNSLSSKLENRKEEINLFLEAFQKSNIKKKLLVRINDGDSYRQQSEILSAVEQFLIS